MKKLYLFCFLFIVSLTSHSQSIDTFDKIYTFPKLDENAAYVFNHSAGMGIRYIESEVIRRTNSSVRETSCKIWTDSKFVLVNKMSISGETLNEETYFYSPNIAYIRSSQLDMPDMLFQMRKKDISYPDELFEGIMAASPSDFHFVKDLISGVAEDRSVILQEIINQKLKELTDFVRSDNDTFKFQMDDLYIEVKKDGILIMSLKITNGSDEFELHNRFVKNASEVPETPEEFANTEKRSPDDSFGFSLKKSDGQWFLSLDEEWSQYLYGAGSLKETISLPIKSINGVLSDQMEKDFSDILKSADKIKVKFENQEHETVFQKFSIKKYSQSKARSRAHLIRSFFGNNRNV